MEYVLLLKSFVLASTHIDIAVYIFTFVIVLDFRRQYIHVVAYQDMEDIFVLSHYLTPINAAGFTLNELI